MEIKLLKDIAADGTQFWHLSDAKGRTVMPFLDYVIESIDAEQAATKTVEARAYGLKKWFQFLSDNEVDLLDVDDSTIVNFRGFLEQRVSINGTKDVNTRRRSINNDIRIVYGFYAWLQEKPRLTDGRALLGEQFCQITSSLLSPDKSQTRSRYPAVFRRVGENSKHRSSFIPKEKERTDLMEYFFAVQDHKIAARNCLIFDIAWIRGWRRASILSLNIQQFSHEAVNTNREFIMVQPAVQKLGYSKSFSVPIALALKIRQYIECERQEIVHDTGSVSSTLFLNSDSGEPLNKEYVSVMFSEARKALGWPRGAGLHSWRRGFANEFLETGLAARIELGLDTSCDSLALDLANELGHESKEAQQAYIREIRRLMLNTNSFQSKLENQKLADENAALRLTISRLELKLVRR